MFWDRLKLNYPSRIREVLLVARINGERNIDHKFQLLL